MTAKEFLNELINIDKMVDCKLGQIMKLRGRLTSIGCATDSERVQTSLKGDKITDTIAKIVELERLVNDDIDKLTEYKLKAREMIEEMENTIEKIVLYKRYFQCESFEQIAIECNYSWRQVHRIHGNALINFEKVFMSYNVI